MFLRYLHTEEAQVIRLHKNNQKRKKFTEHIKTKD